MTAIIPKGKRLSALAFGTFIGFCGVALIDLFSGLISTIGSGYEGAGFIFLFGFYYILFGLPIAYILCFILGIPTFLILNKFREFDMKSAIGMGIFMGSVFGFTNFLLFYRQLPLWFSIFDLASTIGVGAIAGYLSFKYKSEERISVEDFD